uniref:NADH-ubiquinone oxidoreductase chain 3 n=1 Tax=Spinibdella lignicola TaxID=2872682 RepID=A0A977S6I1_9ACAR|nr:NADH dehydrogenase subunit 3 [Spinibdella lignicola]UXN44119.1 NADH dehydrogenase subunit 3 [Spinibdella lignicola]
MMILYIYLIIIIMMIITLIILIHSNKWQMKKTPSTFECGFNTMIKSHQKFSIQFFFVCILFLIFDVEMILIIPSPIMNKKNNKSLFTFILIIMILTIGLMEEWKKGVLEWTK